jgi:hypothetical protein
MYIYKPPPLPYQPLTEMIIALYLSITMYFKLVFIYLDSLDLGLSCDIKISREVLEISDFYK